MSRFQELVIELTDRCPMSCLHCSSTSGPACKSSLTIEIVRRLLTEAAKLQAGQVSFGGGEPTVAGCFEEAIRETIGMGFSAEVFTCGANLSLIGRPVPLSNDLIANLSAFRGRLTFVFSFHGSRKDIHDQTTGVDGSFDCMTESLRRCLVSGIPCTANFVPTKLNVADFQNLVMLLESLSIPKLSILRFVPQGRGLLNRQRLELDREVEDAFVEELLRVREGTSIQIRTGSPFNGIVPDNNVPCRAGHQKLVIQANGNVLPCEVFKHHVRSDWGASVYQMRLDDVMASSKFDALHKTLLKGCCATCPVHGALRSNQSHSGVFHGVSEAKV